MYNKLCEIKNDIEYIINKKLYTNNTYWINSLVVKLEELDIDYISEIAKDLNAISCLSYYEFEKINKSDLEDELRLLLTYINDKIAEQKPYSYIDVIANYVTYKAKTIVYDESTNSIRYLIMSFPSRQQHDAFLSYLQKGKII